MRFSASRIGIDGSLSVVRGIVVNCWSIDVDVNGPLQNSGKIHWPVKSICSVRQRG